MAIEPYQRKIGIPDAAGGGMTRIADTRSVDIGPAISSLGETLMSTFEPILADEAIKRGNEEAGKVMFTRDDKGNLLLPPAAEGGRRYVAAYDKLLETRYLNEVGTEFQTALDQEAADRRTGVKKYNATEFAASVQAKTEGMLSAMDPRIRPQMEEVLLREGLERTRSFANEVSGAARRDTIQGTIQLMNSFKKKMATGYLKNESIEKIEKEYRAPYNILAQSLKDINAVSKEEFQAIMMEADDLIADGTQYLNDMDFLADVLTASGGMGYDQAEYIKNLARGIPVQGEFDPTYQTTLAVPENVTSESFVKYYETKTGTKVNSGARSLTDPLTKDNPRSYHSIANGGRAIDVPRIPGMTFDQWVKSIEDDGFVVLEAKDEYTKPSKHATGPHWHIAVGNKRRVTATKELPALKGITRERILSMDPRARRELEQAMNERQSVIRGQEAQAAAKAREAQQDAKQQQVIDAIVSTTRDGIYNYTNPERDALDVSFNSEVNKVGGLNTEAGRNAAINFISTYPYMPGEMKGWFTSNLRSPNWKSALNLYNSTKVLTTQSGSSMGDILTGALSPKDRALFDSALRMQDNGVDDAVIGAQIKNIISGKSYTASEAQFQFNATRGKDAYRQSKGKALKDLFGIEGIPPKDLSNNYDEAFAANLAVSQNNVEDAEEATRAQLKSLSVADPIFFNGIGYKNVYSKIGNSPKAFNQILMNHLSTLTLPNGQPLMNKVAIADGTIRRPIVGGPNTTIKIAPLDGNVNQVGRYQVYIYDPANRKKLLGRIVVDFSKDLNPQIQAYTQSQRRALQNADKAGIERARTQIKTDRLSGASRTVPVSPF
jgi:hypothetical protein